MRIPAAIWSMDLARNRVSNDWMHVTDLLPTLATAANVSLQGYEVDLDGIDQWDSLTSGFPGPRQNILHNIDPIFNYQIYVEDGWKLVQGTTLNGTYDDFLGGFIEPEARINHTYYYELVEGSVTNQILAKYGKSLDPITVDSLQKQAHVICQRRLANATECTPLNSYCLFDLNEDPCENNNLAELFPEIVQRLKNRIDFYAQTAVEPRNKPADPMADPRYYNNTWTYWQDETPTFPPPTTIRQSLVGRMFVWVLLVSLFIIVAIFTMGCALRFIKRQKKHT